MSSIFNEFSAFIQQTITDLNSGIPLNIIEQRTFSCLLALEESVDNANWKADAITTLEYAIGLLQMETTAPVRGRPRMEIPVSYTELLLSIGFKLVDIAGILKVSTDTVRRRLEEHGISVRSSYSAITDEALQAQVLEILQTFPSTGYKRMKGYLLARGLKVADQRVRSVMRIVDPVGVYYRTCYNRAIVRRQYNIRHFNELWHIDTNLKLRRWNIVVRGCIDGGSKINTYLEAGVENSASSQYRVFKDAVDKYGIPKKTRTDKGGENVQIAEFMIRNRGPGSHICGRSVHNQRIERHWRDVYYGYISTMADLFLRLEHDGVLQIDDPKHIAVLHMVFIGRMNDALERFRLGWNSHPLSSESNRTPNQLMILYPASEAISHTTIEGLDEDEEPFAMESTLEEETIREFGPVTCSFTDREISLFSAINFDRESTSYGYDLFVEAITCLQR